MHVRNSVAIQGFKAVTFAVSAAAAVSGVPAAGAGTYDVWCDVDVFIRVARTDATMASPDRAQDVTTANGYRIAAGNSVPVEIPAGCQIGAIAGGAGTLSYHRVA